MPSPLHVRTRKGLVKLLVLEARILWPNQVAEPWSCDISGICNYIMHGVYVHACARSMHTVRKWRLVSIVCTPDLPIIAFQLDTLLQLF